MIGKKITSGKKAIAFTLAALLSAGLFLTPRFAVNTFAAMDLGGDHTITVLPGSQEMMSDDAQLESSAVVDVYKIATAWPDQRYLTYHFSPESSYSSLKDSLENETEWTAATWESLAYDAAQIALGLDEGADAQEPDCIGQSMGSPISLPQTDVVIPGTEETLTTSAGLYLIIVRGSTTDWNDQDGYVDPNADDLTTLASTGQYIYSYMPQLIAVPSTHDLIEADADGNSPVINTADSTNWSKAVTVRLKPARELALGTFKIIKQLLNCDRRQPMTCVFKVEAEYPAYVPASTPPYSNVVTIVFKEAGEQVWPDDFLEEKDYPMLPVGTVLNIKESYSGANYFEREDLRTVVPADKKIVNGTPVVFTFVDDYNNTDHGGGSVVNTYDFIQNAGSDELTQVGEPEQSYDEPNKDPEMR